MIMTIITMIIITIIKSNNHIDQNNINRNSNNQKLKQGKYNSYSDCNGTRTHNHLVRKQTLNH